SKTVPFRTSASTPPPFPPWAVRPAKMCGIMPCPEGFAAFGELEDTRTGGNTKHHFGEIIFMAYTCILCGMKSYELMEEFCSIRRK
ncbi:MAG: hypothetical protein ACI9NQ_002219, partial [Paracoccaceae bacterium]